MYKSEPDLAAMVEGIKEGYVDEGLWRKIIEKMYDHEDQGIIAD
jgi:hypothetical protein